MMVLRTPTPLVELRSSNSHDIHHFKNDAGYRFRFRVKSQINPQKRGYPFLFRFADMGFRAFENDSHHRLTLALDYDNPLAH